MWNPIASGSTDLLQHVWMYYSMPVEVEAAGGWTQNRRQASLKKTIRAHILQRRKDLKYTDKKQPLPPPPTRPHLQCGGTLCNRLKLGVSPQSCSSKDKKTKKENRRWRLTPTGSRQSSAKQILLQLAQKVSAFYFYCCHVQSSPLRIGSPPPTPQPFRSSSRLSISIVHSEPPSLSLTQRGLA